jgi:fatty acid desaturase
LGLSAGYWHRRHIQLHHAHTNVVGVDDDIEQRPFLVLVQDHLDNSTAWGRFWYKVSRFSLPLLLMGNGPTMQLSSVSWCIKHLAPSKLRWTSVLDAGALLGHYVLWVGLPMLYFDAWSVIAFNLAWSAGTGYLLYCTFVPAHLPEEAIFISPSDTGDYVMRQTATTINFRAGKIHSFLIGGLQYQIEHHLFPGASHNQLAAISEHVEAFCKAHGYPYRTLSYWSALWKATLCFFFPQPIRPLPTKI